MASAPEVPGAGDSWEAQLRGPLAESLAHASVHDVLLLIRRQIQFGHIPPPVVGGDGRVSAGWMEEIVADPRVTDCDLVAEFVADGTSKERFDSIRRQWWADYGGWERKLFRDLLRTAGAIASKVERASGLFIEAFYSDESLRDRARGYEPARGKTWKRYFVGGMYQVARGVVKGLSHSLGAGELNEEWGDGGDPGEPALPTPVDLPEWLRYCLEMMEAEENRAGRGRGTNLRAVFELRHRLYIDPDDYGEATQAHLLKNGHWNTVVEEHAAACRSVKDLLYSLGEHRRERDRHYSEMQDARRQVELLGSAIRSRLILDRPSDAAIVRLSEERAALGPGRRNAIRASEIDYLVAQARFLRARNRCLEISDQLAAAERLERPREMKAEERWVREGGRIATLLGHEQPWAHGLLAEAMATVRDCIRRNAFDPAVPEEWDDTDPATDETDPDLPGPLAEGVHPDVER